MWSRVEPTWNRRLSALSSEKPKYPGKRTERSDSITSPITCRDGSSCSCHRFFNPAVEPFFRQQRASTNPEKSSSCVFPGKWTGFLSVVFIIPSSFHYLYCVSIDTPPAPDHPCEDPLFRHDTGAHRFKDGAAAVTGLSDLTDFEDRLSSSPKPRPNGKGKQFQAFNRQVLGKITGIEFQPECLHLGDALHGKQAHLPGNALRRVRIFLHTIIFDEYPFSARLLAGARFLTPADGNDCPFHGLNPLPLNSYHPSPPRDPQSPRLAPAAGYRFVPLRRRHSSPPRGRNRSGGSPTPPPGRPP